MSEQLLHDIKLMGVDLGIKVISVLLVLIIGFRIVRFIEKRIMKNRSWVKTDPSLQSFLRSFMKMGLKLLVIVTAIYTAGIEMTSFVAVIGAAGLAVGLALQGSLSNLAGGVLIIALRPFRVGDYVEGVGQSGTVTDIGLFYTHLTTPDNRAVIIPNASIANSSIVNYGIFPTRRVELEVVVSNQAKINTVKSVIHEVISQNKMIIDSPEPFVRLSSHGAASQNFTIRVLVLAVDYWDVHFTLIEALKEAFDLAGIEVPLPRLVINQNGEI